MVRSTAIENSSKLNVKQRKKAVPDVMRLGVTGHSIRHTATGSSTDPDAL
jgi:hypothetical protein